MQTTKLRVTFGANGWIAAWFPGEMGSGKLFWPVNGETVAATTRDVVRLMYERRVRKQVFRWAVHNDPSVRAGHRG